MKRHRQDTAIVAAQRADELLAVGGIDGQALWKSITLAILELLRRERRPDERVS